MIRRLARALLLAVPLAALATGAGATHQPDHRFLVIGYVTDVRGKPFTGSKVVVTRVKTGLEHPTQTESDGLYFVIVHLHDEDEGERLRIAAAGATVEIRARFDVNDKKLERGTRVDFRGGKPAESRYAFAETLRDYLAR